MKIQIRYLAFPLLAAAFLLAACAQPSREAEVLETVDLEDAPALDPAADRDPCLEGSWTMNTAELDLLVASMVPIPNLRVVSGYLTMDFTADGYYVYSGAMTLQIEMDMSEGQYLQGDGVFHTNGVYATEARTARDFPVFDFLILDLTTSQNEVIQWRGYKNGEEQTVGGIGPSFTIVPPGEAPYRCTESRLEIDSQGASGPVTMFFER